MSEGQLQIYKSGNVHAIEHLSATARKDILSVERKRNPNRGFIATITKRIKKLRWPRVQQQFYVGPGTDWE